MHLPGLKAFACLFLLVGLSACETNAGPEPLLAVTTDQACHAQPDLTAARALALATNKQVTVIVDQTAPCLTHTEGNPSVYAIFSLPQAMEEFLVSITSAPQGLTLLAPRVMMLDDTGRSLREIQRELFVFHGPSLYLGLRVRPQERYIVVASDPDYVGQQVSHIQSATMSTVASSGTIFVNINTGSEATRDYTYAHNGSITVAATPVPKAN